MPLTVEDGALLGTGIWSAALATFYYKRKQTLPFKVAYFAAWPLLGTAVILICMPSRENLERDLKKNGVATDQTLSQDRQRGQLQMDALREAAGKSKSKVQ